MKLNEARERAAQLKCSGELRPARGLDIIGHDNCLTEAGMFMVYWTIVDGDTGTPHAQSFESADMLPAIALMEQLRTRQRAGEGVRFVTMASENPDSVGHPGVEVVAPGYSWTKRRKRF